MKPFARQFVRGLATPWRLGPLVGAAICLVSVVGLEAFLGAGGVSYLPKKRLLVDATDFVMDFRHNVASHARGVKSSMILLGGSSLRESFIDVAELNERLNQEGAIRLGITGLSLLESLAVVDHLKPSSATLVLGINFGRLDDSIVSHLRKLRLDRVGLRSKAQEEFLSSKGVEWSPPFRISSFFPHMNRYFRKHGWNFFRGVVPESAVPSHSAFPKRDREKLTRKWLKKQPRLSRRFEKNHEMNLEILTLISEISREKGMKFVLLDLPVSPLAQSIFSDVIARYKTLTKEWALKNEVPHLRFVWDLPLREEQFYDGTHLLPEGQAVFQQAFVDRYPHSLS